MAETSARMLHTPTTICINNSVCLDWVKFAYALGAADNSRHLINLIVDPIGWASAVSPVQRWKAKLLSVVTRR